MTCCTSLIQYKEYLWRVILSPCIRGTSEAEGVIIVNMDNKKKRQDYQCNNRRELIDARRQLRKNGETSEAVLWKCLKSRQILGYKFRRQFSVGSYILDFYCPEVKLCIELDGAGHYTLDGAYYDRQREAFLLKECGIRTLRFENKDLYYNLDGVLNDITDFLRKCRQDNKPDPSGLSATSPNTVEE